MKYNGVDVNRILHPIAPDAEQLIATVANHKHPIDLAISVWSAGCVHRSLNRIPIQAASQDTWLQADDTRPAKGHRECGLHVYATQCEWPNLCRVKLPQATATKQVTGRPHHRPRLLTTGSEGCLEHKAS
eukprot:180482-Prymnesium_polylepis.1